VNLQLVNSVNGLKIVKADWSFLNRPEKTYSDHVADCLTNIIMDAEGISEKAFSQVDKVMALTKDFVNDKGVSTVIKRFSNNNCRYEYCAECLYDKYKGDLDV
jgi:hypothetical protein